MIFVKKLILSGLLLAQLNPSDQLIDACLDGDLKSVQTALQAGAAIELQHRGQSPLMLAVYRDYPLIVRYLIQAGANVNVSNPEGKTPLILAAMGGQNQILRELIGHGAELNHQDHDGNSAIMWTAFWGHHETLLILSRLGARLDLRNQDGNTVLHLAALHGSQQHSPQMSRPRRKANGRKLAAVFHDREQAQLMLSLLRAGADPNAQNSLGQNSLMLAISLNRYHCVLALLSQLPRLDLKDSQGKTIFDYARNKADILQLLNQHAGI